MVRTTQARISHGRRWTYAVVLGLLGLAVNTLWLPNILTTETPRFLFGGVFVLISFVRLGPGPGLLSGTLALLGYFANLDAPGWATALYLVEWAFVASFALRWRSLVLAPPLFWVFLGGPLDLILYGGIAGIPYDYVGILWLKQLLNGTLNALLAELLLALPVTGRLLPDPYPRARLRPVLFGRFALGFMALAVLSGLILTRSGFDRAAVEFGAELVTARQSAQEVVLQTLSADALALQGLAVQLSVLGGDARAEELAGRVEPFHAEHPQLINVTVLDAAGTMRVNVPALDQAGDSVAPFNVGDRDYFQEARDRMAPAVSPLILGSLGIRREGVEPILILAVPILGPESSFDGVAYGALDVAALGAALEAAQPAEAAWTTILDEEDRVVWSGLEERPPGMDLSAILDQAPAEAAAFDFQPPAPQSRLDSLEINVRRASTGEVPLFDLQVLHENTSTELYRAMRPVAVRIGLLLLLAEVLVIVTAWLIARQVAAPLQAVASVAEEVVAGRTPPDLAFAGLVEAEITELSDAGRNLRAMVAAVVQARELSREAMERSEDRFRATFEQSAAGLALLDVEGHVVLINERYAELLGRSRESLAGVRLVDLTHPDHRPEERAALQQVRIQGSEAIRVELRPEDAPGRWLDVLVSHFEDRAETPYFLQVAQDVTDRRELEDRLLQTSKLESVGRLAAGVAHDLNNMLTPVLGYARMARDETEEDTEQREWLDQVLRSTDRARGLVSQLLAFGRRQTLRMEPVDLNESVHEFEDTYGRLLRADIALHLDLAPELPPVKADRSQLQQVLVNLAMNAQDALDGSGTIHVRTRPAEIDDGAPAIRLEVWDTGPGIDEDLLPKVFEPFFTTKIVGQGTGLGLPSVHGAIRQMGGEIEAGTADGGGFLVRMVLPAVQGGLADPVPSRADDGFDGLHRIVVVEDDDAVRSLLGRALSSMGMECRTFESGESFFGELPTLDEPDLLLTDVVLPGADGPMVRRRALERFPCLPTLFMSGYSQEVLEDEDLDRKPEILGKPFTLDELREALMRAAGSTPGAR